MVFEYFITNFTLKKENNDITDVKYSIVVPYPKIQSFLWSFTFSINMWFQLKKESHITNFVKHNKRVRIGITGVSVLISLLGGATLYHDYEIYKNHFHNRIDKLREQSKIFNLLKSCDVIEDKVDFRLPLLSPYLIVLSLNTVLLFASSLRFNNMKRYHKNISICINSVSFATLSSFILYNNCLTFYKKE